MRWIDTPVDGRRAEVLARSLGIHPIGAKLLLQSGICEEARARAFLNPRLADLEDPFRLTNMDAAVERLKQAFAKNDSVIIFGDYDVDGVTSTTFMYAVLREFGVSPSFFVPLRIEEGYGLSRPALERAMEKGKPDLLIALDCGTNSVDEVRWLREQGIDVMIIDHHVSQDTVPQDCLLVNPHMHDGEDQPWSQLCTVGLVFKLVHALLKNLREEGDGRAEALDIRDFLDLVALGTIADLVPLNGENRILASKGLDRLQNTPRPGLCALYEVARMKLGDEVSPFDISFRLGPRINASGRLADASVPVNLLLSGDLTQCTKNAGMLEACNRERQDIERKMATEAEHMVDAAGSEQHGLVLFNPSWHPGVVGVVASRISRKYNRPCIILGAEDDTARGSGRSIEGVNMVEVLGDCPELLEHWGGHPMAVGVSLPTANLDAFRERFNEAVKSTTNGTPQEKKLPINAWIDADELGEPLLEVLDRLHPFGQGNPEPVFGVRGVILDNQPRIFSEQHLKFKLPTGQGGHIAAIAWKMAERPPPPQVSIDFAIRLQWNQWNGRKTPQANIVDWRRS